MAAGGLAGTYTRRIGDHHLGGSHPYPRPGDGKEIVLTGIKRSLVAVVAAVLLMLSMTAAPAFAFIHEFIPAGACAASDMAGDNETAEAHLPRVPIQRPPAPDECPAPQK
jgi:hypothetical protein